MTNGKGWALAGYARRGELRQVAHIAAKFVRHNRLHLHRYALHRIGAGGRSWRLLRTRLSRPDPDQGIKEGKANNVERLRDEPE